MPDNTVVSHSHRPTKSEFHSRLMLGLSRAQVRLGGPGALADKMDLTTQALGKVFAGSMPSAHRQWALLDHEPTALDDVAKAYGKRIVDADAVCATAAMSGPVIVDALAKIVQAEADGTLDHTELLDMEPQLRAARAQLDSLIERTNSVRGVVSLPVEGKVRA